MVQAGQFIGSRSDFVPEQICRHLALLCDKVCNQAIVKLKVPAGFASADVLILHIARTNTALGLGCRFPQ